jgi:CRP/FNR family cyclic AMP-dependent transcriptional regulator
MIKTDGKKFFLLASSDEQKKKRLREWIQERMPEAVIYTASDYMEALNKIKNAPPQVLVTDYELGKGRPGQILDTVLQDEGSKMVMIAVGSQARTDRERDGVTLGRLHFVDQLQTLEEWLQALNKAEHAFKSESHQYTVRHLKAGEILIQEGDTSQQIYIVKKGLLRALRRDATGIPRMLGEIREGEFVGEMAYFNEEARMATVEAVQDSELIEIQPAVFEKVIYQRPSWAKILFSTLSKRLKGK